MIEQSAAMEANNIDLHRAWLTANGAAYCHRLLATITAAACEINRARNNAFDCRCNGCGGLNNQPSAEPKHTHIYLLPLDDTEEPESTLPDDEADDLLHNWTALDDDEFDELLSEYFPDDCTDQEEEREPVYLEEPTEPKGRRVLVYIGRCCRCGGYMINALERYDGIKDDAVYRCLCCGWRTSPGYAENRAIHHKGL